MNFLLQIDTDERLFYKTNHLLLDFYVREEFKNFFQEIFTKKKNVDTRQIEIGLSATRIGGNV